jgi:thimet oligopeptidase
MKLFLRTGFLSFFIILLISGLSLTSNLSAQMAAADEVVAFEQQCASDLQEAQQLYDQLKTYDGPKTVETVLKPLNEIWITMDHSANLASVYQAVHPSPEIRKVAEDYDQKFSKLVTEIQMSRPIFDAVSQVDVSQVDPKTKRFVEKTLRDFRRSGVDKDPATREKIKKLEEELVVIGQEFEKNIREDVRFIELASVDQLKGLPEDYIAAHQPDENGIIKITTDYPDYLPFMSYAESDQLRYELYKKYRNRGYPQNESVFENMLQKRYELAQLLGYDNYAQYITEDKMIKSPQAAEDFINKVAQAATPRAKSDYKALLKRLQQEDPKASKVEDWQKTYLAELVQQESYNVDSKLVREYFQYDKVRDGLLALTSKMYQVNYKNVDTTVWHPSVEVYDIWNGDQKVGRFYLDMHPRKDKFKHAMMSEVVSGISGRQLPEAVLVCNFPGGDGTAGLMQHDQVSTYFHEFGHLLHHLFGGHQPWMNISGITTEWDFVEAPSILFEEWIWDADILKTFAVNTDGETIPEELVEKMNRARMFNEGLGIKQQMFYAAISLDMYDRDASSFDPLKLMIELQNKYTPFDYVQGTHMYLSFGHLYGYSAMYYTYQWSEVIAKDLFSRFKQEGLDNPSVAVDYRRKILEPGGSVDAALMVRNFLGRDYSFEAFKDWLNSESL